MINQIEERKMAEVQEVETDDKSNGAIGMAYKTKYGKNKHCGDDIAVLMKDFCTDEKGKADAGALAKVAKANGIDFKKWDHLNIGMQRLSLGNVLRGMLRKGTDVIIGDDTIVGEEQE